MNEFLKFWKKREQPKTVDNAVLLNAWLPDDASVKRCRVSYADPRIHLHWHFRIVDEEPNSAACKSFKSDWKIAFIRGTIGTNPYYGGPTPWGQFLSGLYAKSITFAQCDWLISFVFGTLEIGYITNLHISIYIFDFFFFNRLKIYKIAFF